MNGNDLAEHFEIERGPSADYETLSLSAPSSGPVAARPMSTDSSTPVMLTARPSSPSDMESRPSTSEPLHSNQGPKTSSRRLPNSDSDSIPLVNQQYATLTKLKLKKGVTSVEHLEGFIEDSPYLNLDSPFTVYEWIKFVVLLPWFFIRCLLFITLVWPAWGVMALVLMRTKPREPLAPTTTRIVRAWISFWGYVLLKLAFQLWYIPVKNAHYMRRAEEVRAILIYNHVSYIDPIVLVTLFAPSGVAKAGVAKLPFFGTFAKALRFVFVERKGVDANKNPDEQKDQETVSSGGAAALNERAKDSRYPLVMVAPEGTTKASDCVLKFSSGAFVSGQPVCPILLRYRHRFFNPGWGRYPIKWHLLRLVQQFQNNLEVELCEPYIPNEQEKANPLHYAENVRKLMADKLGYPVVDQGIPELATLQRAGVEIDWLGKHINVKG